MANGQYDAKWVEGFFDQYADQEWNRLALSPAREAQYAVHRHILLSHVTSGLSVLEVGAGPGRFTKDLVDIGCQITVTDISQVQVDLNRNKAAELGFVHGVREWRQLDMCDMSYFNDQAFDAVVAYGGPFSYVMDRRDDAMRECLRVLRPGGLILASVMSLWGTIHQHLEGVVGFTPEENQAIITTGDLCASNAQFATHYCHMFRSGELRSFFESHGLVVLDMAASNALTPVYGDRLNTIREDKERWKQVLDMEVLASREPGYLDGGTHLIIVGRKS